MARRNGRMRHREEVSVEDGRRHQEEQSPRVRHQSYQQECLTSREPKPKEKSTTAEFRRWSKGFCGCLIVLGIVFVFYVITTLIIDNSSPFDFFFPQIYNEDNMRHQQREAEAISPSWNKNDSSEMIVSDDRNLMLNQISGQDLNQVSGNDSITPLNPSSFLQGRTDSAYFPTLSEKEGDPVTSSLKNKRQEPEILKWSNAHGDQLNPESISKNGRSISMAEALHKTPLYVPHKNIFPSPSSGFTIPDKLRNNHRMPLYKRKEEEDERAFRLRRPIPLIENRSFQIKPVPQIPRGKPIPLLVRKPEIFLPKQRNKRPGPPRGLYREPAIDRNRDYFRPYTKRKISSISSPYRSFSHRKSSFYSPHPTPLYKRRFSSTRLPNRRQKYPARRRRPVREEYQKSIPPERFRYPATAASIQDIIEYMSEVEVSEPKLQHQNTQGYNLKSFHSQGPPEFILGSQDHILAHDFSYPAINDSWPNTEVYSDVRFPPDSYEYIGILPHPEINSNFNREQKPWRHIHKIPSSSGNTNNQETLPPVRNTYNPQHDITSKIPRPFELRLDIYPITDITPGSNDPQSFVSVVGNTVQGSYPKDARSQKILLHLNFFSHAPSDLSQSRQSSSGPESEMAFEIPLRGHLSPIDIYKWVVQATRTRPIAYPRKGSIPEEENERQMSPFHIEPGPALYSAIERGLKEINSLLPPWSKLVFTEVTEEDLLKIKNSPKNLTPR